MRQDVEQQIHVIGADGAIESTAAAMVRPPEHDAAWRWPISVGRLPLMGDLLQTGYDFVAANRHCPFGPASRVYWLKVAVALGLSLGLVLSLPLWTSSRFYPLSPVLNGLPPIPYPFDWVVPLALLGLLVATILSSRPRPYIWASVATVSFLVFLDQQRLQPWVYQYAVMLAALGCFSWRFDGTEGSNTTLNISRFVVASIYFWSGLQKLNTEFINDVFPWMIAPITNLFPPSIEPAFYVFGMLVPFIEMGIGVGLLIRRLRNAAIGLAFAMCALVLWAIGPLGHDWNSVVWPWNITMVLLVLILFAKTEAVSLRDIVWARHGVFHRFTLIAFGVLPLLYFFNTWDSYLSWSLYSGTTGDLDIYVSDRAKKRLPAHIQNIVEVDENGESVIPISEWSSAELNVPPYPETRIFRNVGRHICGVASGPDDIVLVAYGRLSWFYRDSPQTWTCADLNARTAPQDAARSKPGPR